MTTDAKPKTPAAIKGLKAAQAEIREKAAWLRKQCDALLELQPADPVRGEIKAMADWCDVVAPEEGT